jgi:hypothetical protein
MQRDHQIVASPRSRVRKEWGQSTEQEHPMEAREHSRQFSKTRRTYGARTDEAERQIRELRARY